MIEFADESNVNMAEAKGVSKLLDKSIKMDGVVIS